MKLFNLALVGLALTLAASQDLPQRSGTTIDLEQTYACPRCRRAKPPGPLKRPNPPVTKPNSTTTV